MEGGGGALTHVVSGEGVGFFNASCLRRGTERGRVSSTLVVSGESGIPGGLVEAESSNTSYVGDGTGRTEIPCGWREGESIANVRLHHQNE